ncbi:MAG: riboflavin synthase [Phycisphaerales bacterium]|jgi:riboflavin synthase|nr:riboflavin synthase [Phycisphaerales bacterium]
MFTGLIEAMGRITAIEPSPSGRRLVVDAEGWDYRPEPGASIAVNGCCLTVVESQQGRHGFDVIPRSLEMTTLGGLEVGASVNLERAATLDTLLGGHLVQGHVDGVGVVVGVDDGDDWRVRIEAPSGVREHLVDRGSITVEGVSLTIARVLRADDDSGSNVIGFEIALIPETLERTILRDLQIDARVNLEADAMAKMVAAHVERLLSDRDRGSSV